MDDEFNCFFIHYQIVYYVLLLYNFNLLGFFLFLVMIPSLTYSDCVCVQFPMNLAARLDHSHNCSNGDLATRTNLTDLKSWKIL